MAQCERHRHLCRPKCIISCISAGSKCNLSLSQCPMTAPAVGHEVDVYPVDVPLYCLKYHGGQLGLLLPV
eukprot:scaffold263987_cov45-Prasinocladus_malaysianus.AAC.1